MKRLLSLSFACLIAACGGDTAPTTPSTPRASAVTVNLPSPLVVGQTQQASATATLASGGTQAVTTGFRSDTPNVATVTDAGLVTPVANGRVNIYTTVSGVQGTANVRVVPRYQGQWRGTYVIRTCRSTGWFAQSPDTCNDEARPGRVLPATMSFTQSGESVSGSHQLGAVPFGAITSPIAPDGSIRFNSTSTTASPISIDTTYTLNSTTDGRLTGGQVQVWRASGLAGDMRIESEVLDMNRIVSSLSGAPAAVPSRLLTRQDFFRALVP